MRYNPAFLSDDELKDTFVVRHPDLDVLTRALHQIAGGARPQHLLLVGQRGSGKTTLLRRLALEIAGDSALAQTYEPVILHEELFEVATVDDLWREIGFHRLARRAKLPNAVPPSLESLRSEFRGRRSRLLVGIENLYMLLADQFGPNETERAASILANESDWLTFIATTTARLEDMETVFASGIAMFTVHELTRLSGDDCRTLVSTVTGQTIDAAKVRPIEILTGGNPRLIRIMATFASTRSLRELMQQLTHLIDEHTSYFKSNLESLPFHERRVFIALAELWNPATTADVARVASLDVNRTSAYINRLMARGLIQIAAPADRLRRYEVTERLYNIYYLMRRSGLSAARVRALVDFMLAFYTPEETMASVSHEACEVPPSERAPYFEAAETLLGHARDSGQIAAVLESIDPAFIDLAPASFRKKHLAARIASDGFSRHVANHPKAPKKKLRRSKDVDALVKSAAALLGSAESGHRDAIALLDQALALDPENPYATFLLAVARYEVGDLDAAYRLLSGVTASFPQYSAGWLLLAATADVAGRLEEAASAYDMATTLLPSDKEVLLSAGVFYANRRQDYARAITLLREALDDRPASAAGYVALADAYARKGDLDGAHVTLQRAAELFPLNVDIQHSMAHVLFERREYERAFTHFQAALAEPTSEVLYWTGITCLRLRRLHDAESYLRRAISMDSKDVTTLNALGELLHQQRRFAEAEVVLKQSLELNSQQAYANHLLGHVYEGQKLWEKAEAAFRRATRLDSSDSAAWVHLGLALEQLDRADDARETFRAGALASKDIRGKLFGHYIRRAVLSGTSVPVLLSETESYLKVTGRTWRTLNTIARALLTSDSYEAALTAQRLSREAAVAADADREPYLTLSEALVKNREWREVIRYLPVILHDHSERDHNKRMLQVVVEVAAHYDIAELRSVIIAADRNDKLAPLRAALDLLAGETPSVPKEVLLVASDVRERIIRARHSGDS